MIEILCDDSTGRRVIIMITTEADNDKRLTFMSVKSTRNGLDHFIYCIFL